MRKLTPYLIITLIAALGILQVIAATIPGTVVSSMVTTGDTANVFPVADTSELQGGFMQMSSLGERNGIPVERRKNYMLVDVRGQMYQLYSSTEWRTFSVGSGAAVGEHNALDSSHSGHFTAANPHSDSKSRTEFSAYSAARQAQFRTMATLKQQATFGNVSAGSISVGTTTNGGNLAINGTESAELLGPLSAAGWTLGAGWVDSGNGTLTHSGTTNGTLVSKAPFAAAEVGTVYKLSVTTTGSGPSYIFVGGYYAYALNSPADFTCYVTASTTAGVVFTSNTTSTFTVTKISLKKVTQGDLLVYGKANFAGAIYNAFGQKVIDINSSGKIGLAGADASNSGYGLVVNGSINASPSGMYAGFFGSHPNFLRFGATGIIDHDPGAGNTANLRINTLYGTNYERLSITGVAGTGVNLTAESGGTGAANLNITLTPKGTGQTIVTGNAKVTGRIFGNLSANSIKGTAVPTMINTAITGMVCGSDPATAIFDGAPALSCAIDSGNMAFTYDTNGSNPLPAMLPYTVKLYEVGLNGNNPVTPDSYQWSVPATKSLLSGSSTASTFTPALFGTYSGNRTNWVKATLTKGLKTCIALAPVSTTKVGPIGPIGATGAQGIQGVQGPPGDSPTVTKSAVQGVFTMNNPGGTALVVRPNSGTGQTDSTALITIGDVAGYRRTELSATSITTYKTDGTTRNFSLDNGVLTLW